MKKKRSWFKPIALAGLASYVYVFMEWVFFATKPSFMSSMNPVQKMMVFFVSGFVFTLAAIVSAGLTVIISKFLKSLRWFSAIVPSLIFTLLSLILLDNFTYTVFKFGIVTSQDIWRGLYAVGFLAAFVLFLRKISIYLQRRPDRGAVLTGYFVLFLFSVSTMAFVTRIPHFHFTTSRNGPLEGTSSELPNIILLGWDGVNATHMSVYGYERDTTPNLSELARNALVAENAFSNAGKTGGSLTSLLTGKLPTETRVIFPPDILLGEDAYQHLPGILKQLGYSTVQITMQYYGDAYERNLQEGFDIINSRSVNINPLANQLARMGGDGSFYFTGLVIQRISERVQHIFFIKKMENPYQAVTEPVYATHDDQRLKAMIDYFDGANGPLFLHVHMMDTHGPIFYVPNQHFSAGQSQDKEWTTDFYDDSILNSDRYIHELFGYLSESGKIKNTIVILYSDHGLQWNPLERVPLIFWFPNGQYAGTIQENVQLIDIAPTILSYLRVPQPAWMQGQSILVADLSRARPILSANVVDELMITEDRRTWILDESKISAPFYQLGKINMVVCQKWFSLNLRDPQFSYGEVQGSTASC
ncbi:MAG TPA: sulfatase-like hydrolase/transferase, partial [Anaerolineales bacterium]